MAFNGFAQEITSDQLNNCVDSCILEFARLKGEEISRSDLELAIKEVGLESTAIYRSLADCQKILDVLKIPTTAVHLKVGAEVEHPSLGIYYIPGKSPSSLGHVIVVSKPDDIQLRVYDPASKSNFVKHVFATDVPTTLDTIAIIPADVARNESLQSTLWIMLASVAIGLSLASCYLYFCRLTNRSPNSSSSILIRMLAISLLQFTSCSPSQTDLEKPLTVEEPNHDFGVLAGEAALGTLEHTFSFTNNTGNTIEISSVIASCGCIVAEGNLEDIAVNSGKTFDLPIKINVAPKLGPFRETVLLRFRDQKIPSQVVSLSGFARRMPKPSASPVRLRYENDGYCTGEVVVSYMRPSHGQPAILSKYSIENSEEIGSTSTTTTDGIFSIKDPSHEHRAASVGAIAEVWRFPVHFTSSGNRSNYSAKMLVSWKHPAVQTTIDLLAEPLPAIELLTQQIHLAPMYLESVHIEKIPIRINNPIRAAQCSITGSEEYISAKIDAKARRLVLSIKPSTSGEFSYPMELSVSGDKRISFEVCGTAR